MADHAVSDQCIDATKRPLLSRRRLYWKVVIFVPEFCKMASQQLELYRVVHVNPHEFAGLAPERFRQRSRVGNRLVKMYRRHVEPMSLPIQEQLSTSRALETNRDYCRDELGKLRQVNVPSSYFVRNFTERGLRGLDLTS